MAKIDAVFELMVIIVNKGVAVEVVKTAREAGAQGGTILSGRGFGAQECGKIFGIPIEPEKEIILVLIDSAKTDQLWETLQKELSLGQLEKGIALLLEVKKVVGYLNRS
ncbi:MAG TPA: P-II family nitrogen regulator [Atribacterota bacterium]|nr:P-II family nitrogen regulator [Atribacterota bacterium]